MAICRGSTPSSLVLIFFLIVYRQFHLQFFLFEALFRFYTSGALFDKLGPFIMEPHKRAKYSKSLDPDEIEEVLLDEDSDEELGDRDEVVEPRVQSSSSSENEDDAEETEVAFRSTRAGDSSNFLNFFWTSEWR